MNEEYEKGMYAGFFESWAFENGLHNDGISRHRVPVILAAHDGDESHFDLQKFLDTVEELDDEGRIFSVGFEEEGDEGFVVLFCTEAKYATWWHMDEPNPDARMRDLILRYTTWLNRVGPKWGVHT